MMREYVARLLVIGSFIGLTASRSVEAQLAPGSSNLAWLTTPAQDAFAVFNWYPKDPASAWLKVSPLKDGTGTARTLLDSALRLQAKVYLSRWEEKQVPSLQLDPLAQLAVSADDIVRAQRVLSERLAAPGLTTADRAYTLLLAIRAFSHDPADTSRMRIALGYLEELDALPKCLAEDRFAAHTSIADAYYLAGLGAAVADHLEQALGLLAGMSIEERATVGFGLSELLQWADVVSGLPRGRVRIDSMITWLRPLTQIPPDLAKSSSAYRRLSAGLVERFPQQVKAIQYLGDPAPPITAQFWLNTTPPTAPSAEAPGAQVKALNDGIIRIMEIGHYGCPGCLLKLPMMERLRQSLPSNIEVWLVSDEGTMWGLKRTTPEEQVQFLADYYGKRGYRFPIAIYIGSRDVMDPDYGTMVRRDNPTAFPMAGWPWFVVTDGRGVVRHIGLNDDEHVLRRVVRYLVAETSERRNSAPRTP